jgi:hypothetical protein
VTTDPTNPLGRYHVERGVLFLCDDQHAAEVWFGEFSDPFVCEFDSVALARRWVESGDRVRVSVDGVLV